MPSAAAGFGAAGLGAAGFAGAEPSGAGGRGLGTGFGAAGSVEGAAPAAEEVAAGAAGFLTGASPVAAGLGRASPVAGAAGRGLPSAETGLGAGLGTGFASGDAALVGPVVADGADAEVVADEAAFAIGAVGFATEESGFAAADLAAGAAFFPTPMPANPLKSGSEGASKLKPCGIEDSVSTATFSPENFGAAVGPGTRTRSFGFRMK